MEPRRCLCSCACPPGVRVPEPHHPPQEERALRYREIGDELLKLVANDEVPAKVRNRLSHAVDYLLDAMDAERADLEEETRDYLADSYSAEGGR